MTDIQASVSFMIPEGNVLKLPSDQIFKNYAQVKRVLLKAGGKYKKNTFVFQGSAADVQARIIGGETVNDKKKFQFFPTPIPVIKILLELADIQPFDSVLEPSAGDGAIVNEVSKISDNITAVEIWESNVDALIKDNNSQVYFSDFLKISPEKIGLFDKIVANPPFSKNQDIDHIRHMFEFLKPGGTMVSVSSSSWFHGSQKKQKEFKGWLESKGAVLKFLKNQEFKESGTNIDTIIITLKKSGLNFQPML